MRFLIFSFCLVFALQANVQAKTVSELCKGTYQSMPTHKIARPQNCLPTKGIQLSFSNQLKFNWGFPNHKLAYQQNPIASQYNYDGINHHQLVKNWSFPDYQIANRQLWKIKGKHPNALTPINLIAKW